MSKKKKGEVVGKLDPNRLKTRDLVTLQEITNGTGCGPHRAKNKTTRQKQKAETQRLAEEEQP